MDQFGIGSALLGCFRVFRECARRTGRTTRFVAQLRDGDVVVFDDVREAQRVRRLCQERGTAIDTRVIDPRHGLPSPGEVIGGRLGSTVRVLFDHGWVEAYHDGEIREACARLEGFRKHVNSPGSDDPPHLRDDLRPWSSVFDADGVEVASALKARRPPARGS